MAAHPQQRLAAFVTAPVYLDHHATTPVDPRVVEAMSPYAFDDFGNASSSSHVFGWRAEAAVALARENLAAAIGARDPSEILFTSGTTESDNLALLGTARAAPEKNHLITTAIEHPAVLETSRALKSEGFDLTVLPVDRSGLVDPDAVARAITDRTIWVSVMAANSEVGTLQPLAEIGRICRERAVLFHTDAAQAVGKVPIDVQDCSVDMLSMCAHKLYGPKGIGLLYVGKRRPRVRIRPLVFGGGQEAGRRSGTLPVSLIVGFAKAVEICLSERDAEARRLSWLRQMLWKRLSDALGNPIANGHLERRLPGTLSVSFPGVSADQLIAALPQVALSAGSACASGSPEPSHVLRAIGLSDEMARSTLRFGLGRGNDADQIGWVADRLIEVIRELRGGPDSRPAATLSSPGVVRNRANACRDN
ncbi:MAG: cysteine desulfurase family protein [Myxococcota bacterium]